MRKLFLAALLCLALAAAPLAAMAASEEGGAGWGWIETAGRWFNLLVLFGVIYFAVRTPLGGYFEERRAGIQKQITEAVRARQAAEEKLAKMEARMKNLDGELAAIREEARRQSDLERQRIAEQAASEGEKIMAAANREIEGLSLAVRKELKAYAAQLAVQLAEEQIRGRLTDEAEKRVIDGFFADLSARAGR